jgi:hypothetical protein
MSVNSRIAEAAISAIAEVFDLIAKAIVAGDWSFDQIHYEMREWTN